MSPRLFTTAKDIAFIGIIVASMIAGQIVFAAVAGIEIVTVLFLAFCVAYGVRRGMIAGTVFSLLRCMWFGFVLNVVVVYILYYNLFAVIFGLLGRMPGKWPTFLRIAVLTIAAAAVTACFSLLDDLISPLILGLSARGTRAYFYASLPVMATQSVCAAVTVALLWYPLSGIFALFTKNRPRQ